MQGIIPLVVSWLLLILGLSYAVNTAMWLRVVRDAMAQPAHYFYLVILTLVLGLAVVAGHNVWVTDWPVAITLFGWILVVKSTLFLLFPQSIRLFSDWSDAFMTTWIRVAGLLLTLLGAVLVYHAMPN